MVEVKPVPIRHAGAIDYMTTVANFSFEPRHPPYWGAPYSLIASTSGPVV